MTNQLSKRIIFITLCIGALVVSGALTSRAQGLGEWRTAYLTQSAVLDIAVMDDGQAWAVGEAGIILHYDGESWRQVESPTEEGLHAVAFSSADDGWAVGQAGTILRYRGGAWHSVSAPTTGADVLFDITLVGAGGWAVGQRFDSISGKQKGLILRLRDGEWTEAAISQTRPLSAVAFASPDDGWAVGQAGTRLRWDGSEWIAESVVASVDLQGVTTAGDDVWAVGDSGILVRWNEGSYHVESQSDATLTDVGFAGPEDGWAIGAEGMILHYDGRGWFTVNMSLDTDLFGLFIDIEGIPWMTGDGGLIGRVTPDGWQFAAQPYVDVDLTAIDLLDNTAGWVMGSQPPPFMDGVIFWRYAGKHWAPRLIHDALPLFDVDILSESEAWAVGQNHLVEDPREAGIVWRYTDGAWRSVDAPGVSALFAVEAVGPNDVWAAGQDGSLIHYNGAGWQELPTDLENVHFFDLHFLGPNDGWVVGRRFDLKSDEPRNLAVSFHYDGEGWEEIPIEEGPPRLLAVHAVSGDDVWAVGDLGAILHYDGARWTVVQGQREYDLLDVHFAGPGDGWAVGTQGTILRFRGHAWQPALSPTIATLKGVVGRPWGEAWVVGSHGAFFYHPGILPQHTYLPLIGR